MAKKQIYTSGYTGPEIDKILKTANEEPVFWYYDENNALYRMFANEESRDKWLTDTEQFADLELFQFSAPTPYTATLTGLSEDTKHVRFGDQSDTVLSFRWNISGKNQDNFTDSVTITYSFENNGTQVVPIVYSHSQQNVSFDMFPYLRVGTNTVVVELTGNTTNATVKVMFNVEVLDLALTSEFKFQESILYSKATVDVPYSIVGTPNYIRMVEVYIDGNREAVERVTAEAYEYSAILQITNDNKWGPGLHTLQLIAYVTINGVNYYSNLLYYNFVISGFNSLDVKYIMCHESFEKKSSIYANGEQLKLEATQFEDFVFDWAFFTSDPYDTLKAVVWQLEPVDQAFEQIAIINARQGSKPTPLVFAPSIYGQAYLKAYIDGVQYASYDLQIHQNKNNVSEASGHIFKLSAKSRSNDEPYSIQNPEESLRDKWEYTFRNALGSQTYKTTFHNVLWNSNSGWEGNALVLSNGASADIDCEPLNLSTVGRLFANDTNGFTFEIEFETFNVGDKDEPIIWLGDLEGASIQITPNSAFMTNNTGVQRIKTNFRENERVRLSFILNSSVSLTDAQRLYIVNNGVLERGTKVEGESFNGAGGIHLDGTLTGIRIYSMKLFSRGISYAEAFSNWVIESKNINEIINRNDVYDSLGRISEQLCEQKIDVITIEGPLDSIINAKDKGAECSATIKRVCLADKNKSFTIINGRIRRHGQSSLDYPVPNFKIWSDKEAKQNAQGAPVMYDNKGAVIYKGRYAPKDGIPAKKWVLQANFADSSGVHNGGLLRLINDTWYLAQIDSDYKLRTPPQQYATSTGEFKNAGYKQDMGRNFPHKIRIAPDSFPCVLFWRPDEESDWNFLGQYVFMDDKKANDLYGESSIYDVFDDPFRLKGNAPKKEDCNRLWDNKNVLRFEILSVNTPYVNYTSMQDWDKILPDTSSGAARSWKYNWENDFELIYPEVEDIYNLDGKQVLDINDPTPLVERVQPFKDWMTQLVQTYEDYKRTGSYDSFKEFANAHLDLYKLAAYYIYVLRFGLVDSLQRNAQLKTYDGIKWWYEPWDMDIALGNKNTGGIAFEPPIDRNTQDPDNPGTYWISGKNGTGNNFTSCWLWDALEAWTTETGSNGEILSVGWIDNIVPNVANALYGAGLTYDKVIEMFDNEYENKWCERMYNDSGHYKYVENGAGDYLQYLQGARASHRHYWTKASFDYWDAKWACGEFRKNRVTIITNTTDIGQKIYITPTTSTYFSFYNGTTGSIEISSDLTTKNEETYFTMDRVLSTKDPRSIFGSLYIAKLDISEIAQYLERLNLGGLYSDITGSNIVELNIGMPWDYMLQGRGQFNYKTVIISDYQKLNRLESLYVRGYRNVTSFNSLLASFTNLKNFYAAGSGLTVFENCLSIGNQFHTLEFPDSLQSLTLYNALWDELKFYHTNIGETHEREVEDADGNIITETYTEDTYLDPTALTEIPDTLKSVTFTGNTCSNRCSVEFVKKWIADLNARSTDDYNAFADKSIYLENVNWFESDNNNSLTFQELLDIAKFGTWVIKGYVKIILPKDPETGVYIQPTSADLTLLRNTFGDYIFSLGSSDLIVDYEDNIIVISGPAPMYSDENQNLYLQEGNSVQLQATVFTLRNVKRIQYWGISPDGGEWSDATRGVYINQETGVLTVPETTQPERTILIACQDSTDANNPRVSTINLTITKRTYPDSIFIKGMGLKYTSGIYSIGSTSETYRFRVATLNADGDEEEFTGTITGYSWSYTDNNGRINTVTGTDTEELSMRFTDLNEKVEYEDIVVTVTYANGVAYTVSTKIGMIKQVTVLQDSIFSNTNLYYTFDMYRKDGVQIYPHSGSTYYSDDVSEYTGMLDLSNFDPDNINAENKNYNYYKSLVKQFRNGTTRSARNTILYFTNVDGVNISNFPALQELHFKDYRVMDSVVPPQITEDDTWRASWLKNVIVKNNDLITKYDFTPIDEVVTIDCSDNDALETADFTGLQNLTTIDASHTNANLTLGDNPNLESIKYGTPTEIIIPENTKIENETLDADDYTNITKFDISLNNTSWSTLLKSVFVGLGGDIKDWMVQLHEEGIPYNNLIRAYNIDKNIVKSFAGTNKRKIITNSSAFIIDEYPNPKNNSIEITIDKETISYSGAAIFGSIYGYTYNNTAIRWQLGTGQIATGTRYYNYEKWISMPSGEIQTIKYGQGKCNINGQIDTISAVDKQLKCNIGVGVICTSPTGSGYTTSGLTNLRIYNIKYYEADKLLHYYIPIIKDGVATMLDLVTFTEITKIGTQFIIE